MRRIAAQARQDILEAGLEAWRRDEEDRWTSAGAEEAGAALDRRIMAAVRLLPRPRRELHAGQWAAAGLVFFLSLAFIPFSRDFRLFRELYGTSYSLPLFLVLGICLTLFGAVFIASHIEELEPYVRRRLGGLPRT